MKITKQEIDEWIAEYAENMKLQDEKKEFEDEKEEIKQKINNILN